MKRYLDVIMCGIVGAVLLTVSVIAGIPTIAVLPTAREADIGGVLLLISVIQAVWRAWAGAMPGGRAWQAPSSQAIADAAAVAATALLLAAATLACWRHGAVLTQAAAAFVFGALAIWSARSLFRALAEGGRVEFRSHWGGLGGGLGGMELSRAATLLLIFLLASVAAVAAARRTAPPAVKMPETGTGITHLSAA